MCRSKRRIATWIDEQSLKCQNTITRYTIHVTAVTVSHLFHYFLFYILHFLFLIFFSMAMRLTALAAAIAMTMIWAVRNTPCRFSLWLNLRGRRHIKLLRPQDAGSRRNSNAKMNRIKVTAERQDESSFSRLSLLSLDRVFRICVYTACSTL